MKGYINHSEIEKAVVSLPTKGGRGVLVKGGKILTAAHCISCTCSSRMALNFNNPIKVIAGGNLIWLNILFVDPVSDIAVLGQLDVQDFPMDNENFNKYISRTKPLRIAKDRYHARDPFHLWIFNKDKQWVEASGEVSHENAHRIIIESDKIIKPGASGGPIVNDFGALVSINSEYNVTGKSFSGLAPRPFYTLPKWILH